MAKRGILDHPKTEHLAELLGIADWAAVGLLECFWQKAAQYYPCGDVSRLTPRWLAKQLHYDGDPQELWAALTRAGWVDVLPDGRTLIHDWREHAEDAVHLALARKILRFGDGELPRLTRLSREERTEIEAAYQAQNEARKNGEFPENVPGGSGVRTGSAPEAHCHGLSLSPPLPSPNPPPTPPEGGHARGGAREEPPRQREGEGTIQTTPLRGIYYPPGSGKRRRKSPAPALSAADRLRISLGLAPLTAEEIRKFWNG